MVGVRPSAIIIGPWYGSFDNVEQCPDVVDVQGGSHEATLHVVTSRKTITTGQPRSQRPTTPLSRVMNREQRQIFHE